MTKKKTAIPAKAIRETAYADLMPWIEKFKVGQFNCLTVLSPPGLLKSRTLARHVGRVELGGDGLWIEGKDSAFIAHQNIWHCMKDRMGSDGVSRLLEALRTKKNAPLDLLPSIPVVMDDIEEWDGADRKYLKSLLNTDDVKWPSWDTNATANAGVPGKYPVRVRVCWLANQMKLRSIDDEALLSRGICIHFCPLAAELHAEIIRRGWFHDLEILNFVAIHLPWIAQPDARNYVHAKEIKDAGLDWQKYLYQQWFADDALVAVMKLLRDPAFSNNKKRSAEFVRQGRGAGRTFYNKLKQLKGDGKNAALLQTPLEVCKTEPVLEPRGRDHQANNGEYTENVGEPPVDGNVGSTKPPAKNNGDASTPQWLFDCCNQLAVEACGEPITLDVAAASWNHKCDRFLSEQCDGLKQDWNAKSAWCNPPYSPTIIESFVQKALEAATHGTTTICLLPSWNYPYLDLCEQHGRIHRICSPVTFLRQDGSRLTLNNGYRTTALIVVLLGPTIQPGYGTPIRNDMVLQADTTRPVPPQSAALAPVDSDEPKGKWQEQIPVAGTEQDRHFTLRKGGSYRDDKRRVMRIERLQQDVAWVDVAGIGFEYIANASIRDEVTDADFWKAAAAMVATHVKVEAEKTEAPAVVSPDAEQQQKQGTDPATDPLPEDEKPLAPGQTKTDRKRGLEIGVCVQYGKSVGRIARFSKRWISVEMPDGSPNTFSKADSKVITEAEYLRCATTSTDKSDAKQEAASTIAAPVAPTPSTTVPSSPGIDSAATRTADTTITMPVAPDAVPPEPDTQQKTATTVAAAVAPESADPDQEVMEPMTHEPEPTKAHVETESVPTAKNNIDPSRQATVENDQRAMIDFRKYTEANPGKVTLLGQLLTVAMTGNQWEFRRTPEAGWTVCGDELAAMIERQLRNDASGQAS